jgi:hypothetical protein
MTYQIKQLNDRTTKGIAVVDTTVHDYIILQAMQTIGSVSTIEDIVALTGNNYVTKDPLIKSVKWHLNKLKNEGVVEFIDDTPTPVVKVKKVKSPKVETTPVA